jgi:hypothetical protein
MPENSSAVRSVEGRVFTGETHAQAYLNLVEAGDTFADKAPDTGWVVEGRYYPDDPANNLEPHAQVIQTAYKEGQNIPRSVVAEYKGEAWAEAILADMDAKAGTKAQPALVQGILSAVKDKSLVPADYVAGKPNPQEVYDAAAWLSEKSDGRFRLPKTQQQKIKAIQKEALKQGAKATPAQPAPSGEIGPPAASGEAVGQDEGPTETPPEIKEQAAGQPLPAFGTRNAVTERIREMLGLDGIPSPEKQTQAQWLQEAHEQGLTRPKAALDLAAEIVAAPRTLTPQQDMGIKWVGAQLNLESQRLGQEARTAPEAAKRDIEARRKHIDTQIELLTRAADLAGTEWSRAGVSRQVDIDDDGNLQNNITRIETALGHTIDATARAEVVKLTDELVAAREELARLKQQAAEAEAAAMVKKLRGASRYVKMTEAQKDTELQTLKTKVAELMKAGC